MFTRRDSHTEKAMGQSSLKSYAVYLACCVVAGLLVLELILRLFFPAPYFLSFEDCAEYDPRYGFSASWGINSCRFTSNKERILIVGDSFVGGANSFTNHFAADIEKLFPSRFEVATLSTPGWGTDQEYLAFKNEALSYQPDIVILTFCLWNDIPNNLSIYHGISQIKPFFILEGDGLAVYRPDGLPAESDDSYRAVVHRWLYVHSRVYFYTLQHFKIMCKPPLFSDKEKNIDGDGDGLPEEGLVQFECIFVDRITHFLPFVTYPKPVIVRDGQEIDLQRYGYELTFEILKKFQEDVTAYGGDFYLFLLPLANPYGWNDENPIREVRQKDKSVVTLDYRVHRDALLKYAEMNAIETMDISAQMEERFGDGRELLISSSNLHYNKKGEAFVSAELAEHLAQKLEL